tara:strand:+ start:423 stop:863 length:441 start_codon:yes stop_codon:yes gene_type:complete
MTNTAENTGISEGIDIAQYQVALKSAERQRDEAESARAAAVANLADMQRNQDRLAEALMIVLGDPIDALIESKIEDSSRLHSSIDDMIETAMQEFDIDDHRCAIEDMIDARLSERLGDTESEDDRQAAVEEIVRDVISGASISIDI